MRSKVRAVDWITRASAPPGPWAAGAEVLVRRVLTDVPALEALVPAWERLLANASEEQPVLSPTWLLAWWRVFGARDGRALRVLALFDGERLVALAPLLVRDHRHLRVLPFRRLEALGSGEDEADEILSEYLGFLVERGREAPLLQALVNAIADGALGRCDELFVPRIDGDRGHAETLRSALTARGFLVTCEEATRAPFVTLPARYSDYLAGLGSSHRYVVTRSRRDLEAWAGAPIEHRLARTAGELEEGTAILRRLHGERWSARGEQGNFEGPLFRAFHGAVMPELLARGALRLSWILARGEPLAALYSIVWGGKLHFYQGGRRVDLPPKLRPGIVAHAMAIEHAIGEGLREYDFLGGEMRYKQQLATGSRALVDLRAARPSLRERLRVAGEAALDGARGLRTAFEEARSAHRTQPSSVPAPADAAEPTRVDGGAPPAR